MPKKYVFGLGADGRSDILMEEDITTLSEFAPGMASLDVWLNRETPADLSDPSDPVSGKPMVHEPPEGGAVFRMIDFLPKRLSKEDMLSIHSQLHSVHVPEHFEALKDPSMHKTDTLNYFCLLSGELWALSEGRDVLLQPGDVLIQRGCMHGWRNEGTETARLIAVLIDSLPA